MPLKDKLIILLASGGFCGFSPKAPGTVGSILALPLCYGISKISAAAGTIIIFFFIIIGTWVAHTAEKSLSQTDPGCIVIDEMAGLMVTFIYIPFTVATALMGFIIFRLLDILKPFPISWIEKKMTGGPGIMADDIAAGILGNTVLRLIISFTPIQFYST